MLYENFDPENKKFDRKNFLWNANQIFYNGTNILQILFDLLNR